jgi:hypothetical protein
MGYGKKKPAVVRTVTETKTYYEDGLIETVTRIENHLTGGSRVETATKRDARFQKSVELTRRELANVNIKGRAILPM